MQHWKVSYIAFFDHDGKIMLNRRLDWKNPNEAVYEMIGGSVKDDEQPIEAIKREIMEELDYEIDEVRDEIKLINKFEFDQQDRHYEVYAFKAKFPGFDKFSDTEEINVEDLRLCDLEEALNLYLLPMAKEIVLYLAKQK